MASEGHSILPGLLNRVLLRGKQPTLSQNVERPGQELNTNGVVFPLERARQEFETTGTLHPQMVHVDAEDNEDNHAFDLYFEDVGSNVQTAFVDKFQAVLDSIKLKARLDGSDRFIIKYFPHLNRIVWSPSVNSDMNIESAIGEICGENAVPDPRAERYHVEITHDKIDMVATDTESARRLLAFLEATIPTFVHTTRFKVQITLENGRVDGIYKNIDHLKDEIGKLSSF